MNLARFAFRNSRGILLTALFIICFPLAIYLRFSNSKIAAWVQASFTARTVGGVTLYDLTAPAA